MALVPTLQIRHDEKDAWWVAAKWPSGQTEDIQGFSSEAEANEWIANELQTWLDERAEAAKQSHGTLDNEDPDGGEPAARTQQR